MSRYALNRAKSLANKEATALYDSPRTLQRNTPDRHRPERTTEPQHMRFPKMLACEQLRQANLMPFSDTTISPKACARTLQVCLQGPEAKLEETSVCQPAMFLAGGSLRGLLCRPPSLESGSMQAWRLWKSYEKLAPKPRTNHKLWLAFRNLACRE